MSVPTFLSNAYNEPQDATHAIPDVETGGVGMISMLRLLLVTNGNWTEPSTGLFQSPADPGGAWMDILMTRIDADTMEFRVRDQNGNTIRSGRIDIEAAGNTTVDYFVGNYHVFIWSKRATAEQFQAYILETSPNLPAAVANRVVAQTLKTTAGGTTTAAGTVGNLFAWDNGTSAQHQRIEAKGIENGSGTSTPTLTARGLVTPTGRLLNDDASVFVNHSGSRQETGRLPCCLLVDSSLAFDTVRNGPVDGATQLAFAVLPLITISLNRMAIRKPSFDS